MTWLARVLLSKDDLASCRLLDNYAWHKAVWQCFPDMSDADRDFLLRLDWQDSGCRAYILSGPKPLRPGWCPPSGWAAKEIAPGFLQHARYRFDLLANPTRKLVVRDASGQRRKNGRRVPLVHEDDQRRWLEAKAQQHGFSLVHDAPLAVDPAGRHPFRRQGVNGLHVGVRFRGVLNVTDRELFASAFRKGVGSAKGFGFGMLLLQPIF
ncbi:MAG: type I-E CRISPR-associated protein Cas6/Cse3/CasE [Desulfovibrionaceae bacterium]|nr:type I-E CRISPR-associated protein Cas6/Cse3/CasE [Desulfovibrionaceae bacterium]